MHNSCSNPRTFDSIFLTAPVNHTASPSIPLAHLGVLTVRGVEARKFLNGQLSQDVLGLAANRVELAGLHNAQGRMIALLRLVPLGTDDVLCVLPRTLLADTLVTLRKFLLRAKATLADESANWIIEGLADDAALPPTMGSARVDGARISWRHAADGRVMRLRPTSPDAESSGRDTRLENDHSSAQEQALAAWQLADIAAGLPEITESTRGEFVAQMLNLDALGGISFTKGCYTGQEVIARAHYRGRVKRRVQRFRITAATWSGDTPQPIEALQHLGTLQPGQKVRLNDGGSARAAQIVNVAHGSQGIECLAVTSFGPGTPEPAGSTNETVTSDTPSHASSTDMPTLTVVALPMSYALPE
jgi:folate-binding protein YgfZ